MIKSIDYYLDGGTIEMVLENGESYCIDDRLETETKHQLYKGYPKDDNSNIIEYPLDEEIMLMEMLEEYKNKSTTNWADKEYVPLIKNILKENVEKKNLKYGQSI